MSDNMDLDRGGVKFDSEKPRFDLLPPEALWALADLFTKGAQKYEARNWEKGMRWGRTFSAMQRHAWAWLQGEECDPDPVAGTHHLIHVAWNALVLYTFVTRGIGDDDRPEIDPCASDPAVPSDSDRRRTEADALSGADLVG